jgi:pimeloyl-ACP methyl ester carboxylesterase
MATFLFVPGAWLGGWCWRNVAASLRASGHTVLCPTLTGLGERAHLLSPEIDLETHVSDIVGLFHYRDLSGVILVGHSYGGTVITAVAERMPERIARLVYLDASVPRDGESNNDVIGPTMAAQLRSLAVSGGDGWKVPPPDYVVVRLPEALRPWVGERLTPIRSGHSTIGCTSCRQPQPRCRECSFRPRNRTSTTDSWRERARQAGTAAKSEAATIRCSRSRKAVASALKELPA